MTAMSFFLPHFAPFFRAPLVMPELSASFSSFRVLTPVLVLESRVDCSLQEQSERVTNLEQWSDQLSEHLNECLDRVTNLEQWGEELTQSL